MPYPFATGECGRFPRQLDQCGYSEVLPRARNGFCLWRQPNTTAESTAVARMAAWSRLRKANEKDDFCAVLLNGRMYVRDQRSHVTFSSATWLVDAAGHMFCSSCIGVSPRCPIYPRTESLGASVLKRKMELQVTLGTNERLLRIRIAARTARGFRILFTALVSTVGGLVPQSKHKTHSYSRRSQTRTQAAGLVYSASSVATRPA